MNTRGPVVIVSMPFHGADRPSIQAGLLAAIVREHGFAARTLHANLDLAARIGPARYEQLAQHRDRMLGEWLFSVAAFGARAPDPGSALLDDLPGGFPDRKELLRIRHEVVPAYLDDLVNTYEWRQTSVAGFTCTFQQNTASFALARRLKNRFPDLVTVFGGANFDDEMGIEWVRTIDCVDYAIRGEADESFPQLLHALATGDNPAGIPGVIRRDDDGTVTATPPAPPSALPVVAPDYDEFFRADHDSRVWIPIETSRGCWWGEKHHCTFCGLNATTMRFRAKPPGSALEELDRQARRYGHFTFAAVDNILDTGYLRTLLPELAARDRGYELFYEIKANLRRDQVRLLARAGVTRVQPGLESLSTRVLALMRKGATAPQNVNLLRWARYYGLDVQWNLLWGFPGETRDDYTGQAALVPRLAHLQPPGGADRIWLERFSPLFTDERVRGRRPERSYAYVYPPSIDLERVAYFFEYEVAGGLPEEAYDGLRRAAGAWQRAWDAPGRPSLTFRHAPRFLQVYDARHPGHECTHTFDGPAADVYSACSDRPARARAVRETLGLSAHTVHESLAEFDRLGLMLLEDDTALALALPAVAGR
ncbi:RiPP maturation radical SAM C-methyltransferase [Paractinoplanes brasiliensis]|uniref:Ribosomal peptide maturation radical SAM protein 1 n=1 Tax=Paractinoplanes brasiliensis TaxID=52695 RepID=A0A4R6JBF4_9ACTN|nr:RiPP maturation radical SAM C-methyltransferase [Actinoplanes brasiliensis]TDO31816.1 ribosomal peptide maturation radical SAM protein 1 [Actinoplanes brasiliensis]GID30586.1 RiPP maturation radical SAM protein 1 [Actinoplanes brasiliensis]